MLKENYNVIGVMSGTSLDGIDLAHIHFSISSQKWTFEIIESQTVSYSSDWVSRLKAAVDYSPAQLQELNEQYTLLLSQVVNDFIKKYNIKDIDTVCSHGHTILHQPQNGFTLQIGNLPQIAALTNQTIVCDFRVQDIQLGGQGAPLVPIGDRTLFAEYDYCLNLGGFSNISFEQENKRIAFDISPVNTVLNFYANMLGLPYDDKGSIAKSGKRNSHLLDELNQLDFYQKKFPKSLGFEFVKETILPIIESYTIAIEDKLHTFIEHIAIQTAGALPEKQTGQMLATGGGAYNTYLIERIQSYLPHIKIVIPQSQIIEYKEALIFALLGVLKLRSEINVLGSVTGAKHDHSSGNIYLPK